MPDLIPPHGGVREPVNRTVTDIGGPFAMSISLSDADLSSLYRIGDGGLSPLTGPMTGAEWNQVLDEEVIVRDGKKYAWTIPISFPASAELARTLKTGETVALVNNKDEVVGTLTISDIFAWDKPRYIKGVYGTERTDHPGGRMVTGDARELLLGGEVR